MFTPTYLYIKRHKITGLKYFGKTVKSDPFSYLGSGTRWTRHIRKHGTEHVETVWCQLFTTKEELVSFATEFSVKNNITESQEWANLDIETGLDGGPRKNNHFKQFNRHPKPQDLKQKISTGMVGNKNRSIPIVYNGTIYESTSTLSKELNVTEQTVRNWKRKGKVLNLK